MAIFMLALKLRAIQISVLKLAADLDQEAGVKIHGLAGCLGLKMHCWAGWRGHVPLLQGVPKKTEFQEFLDIMIFYYFWAI